MLTKIVQMKISFILLCFLISLVNAKLRVGFYEKSCPRAEIIIQREISKLFRDDPSITGALLRLHFHDCAVSGCDASILIDSTPKKQSEKDAAPNFTLRGFEIIDKIKKKLEAACPKTVSCADILTLATKDLVALAGGPKYSIPTGRRDGLISDLDIVNLPFPSDSVSTVLEFFKIKGFNNIEAVALMGAHTVGRTQCGAVLSRLTENNGKPDRNMDPALAIKLQKICKKGKAPFAFLDQNTSFVVDNEFYNQIQKKRGILHIDQALALDNSTAPIVSVFANKAKRFDKSFAKVMVKLANLDVILGNKGEIRNNCRKFNAPSS